MWCALNGRQHTFHYILSSSSKPDDQVMMHLHLQKGHSTVTVTAPGMRGHFYTSGRKVTKIQTRLSFWRRRDLRRCRCHTSCPLQCHSTWDKMPFLIWTSWFVCHLLSVPVSSTPTETQQFSDIVVQSVWPSYTRLYKLSKLHTTLDRQAYFIGRNTFLFQNSNQSGHHRSPLTETPNWTWLGEVIVREGVLHWTVCVLQSTAVSHWRPKSGETKQGRFCSAADRKTDCLLLNSPSLTIFNHAHTHRSDVQSVDTKPAVWMQQNRVFVLLAFSFSLPLSHSVSFCKYTTHTHTFWMNGCIDKRVLKLRPTELDTHR